MNETLVHNSLKIISGGQTGVDRAALDVAIELGVEHGGFCPKGRKAEDGKIDEKYKLKETKSDRYYIRTLRNIKNSDVTIVIFKAQLGRGTAVTEKYCKSLNKKYLMIDSQARLSSNVSKFRSFILKNKPETINIAGNRESTSPGIYDYTKKLLTKVLS